MLGAIDRVGGEIGQRAEVLHPGFGAERRPEHGKASVVVLDEGRPAHACDHRVPVAARDRLEIGAHEGTVRRMRASLAALVAAVELGPGGVLVFEVEERNGNDAPVAIDLVEHQVVVHRERSAAARNLARETVEAERQPFAARGAELRS